MFAEKGDIMFDIDDYVFTTEAHLLPLSLSRCNGSKPASIVSLSYSLKTFIFHTFCIFLYLVFMFLNLFYSNETFYCQAIDLNLYMEILFPEVLCCMLVIGPLLIVQLVKLSVYIVLFKIQCI